MTETEADILDELYFVTSFKALANELSLEPETLCAALKELATKGYVKCLYPDPDSEIDFDSEGFGEKCRAYYFLATKAGLLAHNSR